MPKTQRYAGQLTKLAIEVAELQRRQSTLRKRAIRIQRDIENPKRDINSATERMISVQHEIDTLAIEIHTKQQRVDILQGLING